MFYVNEVVTNVTTKAFDISADQLVKTECEVKKRHANCWGFRHDM